MTADNPPIAPASSSPVSARIPRPPAIPARDPRLVLSSPTSLIAAVPYLIGYRPGRALVVVLVRDSDIVLTATTPLPGDDVATVAPDDLRSWAACLLERCRSAGAQAAYITAFTAAGLSDAAPFDVAAADAVREQCVAQDIAVRDVLVVGVDRWRSLLCASVTCCPPEGRPRADDDTLATEAALVMAGAAPVASRGVIERELDHIPGPFADEVRRLGAAVPDPQELTRRALEAARTRHIAAVCEWVRGAGEPSAGVAGSVLWLFDSRVRDTVLWELLGEADSWRAHADRLAILVRALPRGCIAPAATVLAGLRWASGDGARASVAVEVALADDEGYLLAQMIRAGVEGGIPPREWVECLRGLPRQALRRGTRGGRRARSW